MNFGKSTGLRGEPLNRSLPNRHAQFITREPNRPDKGRANRFQHRFLLIRFGLEEVRLINLDVLQRLRGIQQLAMASLVYPGALHTRFDHTLGVAHVAGEMADALGLDAEERTFVRQAALLHDDGARGGARLCFGDSRFCPVTPGSTTALTFFLLQLHLLALATFHSAAR
jgi:hypothetical protein